ncbi:class I SAM-dependent methyltransferase [Speluncibacter jeojiensis]|uniref:Methyltransferase domain-containing protein n=1 Tax=Speluncibacter jeojiensis TaxID=2710754 RepID=A0A9X4LVE5_9ACTN|nr:methyltransferase domain-containing protein [Corynebacteriales bacterium D3-21]
MALTHPGDHTASTASRSSRGARPAPAPLPLAERDSAHLPGHWLLARLGKRVLRPGGVELTSAMLDNLAAADGGLAGADVVELAPGLGHTAARLLDRAPGSYTGVEYDESAAAIVRERIGTRGRCVVGEAAGTGLPDHSADVVLGEAMLTMQTDRHKAEIIAEASRVLRPGGRYAVHELALRPDDLDDRLKNEVQRSLARSIKVNARPLTIAEWRRLLTDGGFEVTSVATAPMALLEARRLLADEGVARTARITANLLRDRQALRRVLDMRSTFVKYRREMTAVSLVATKVAG